MSRITEGKRFRSLATRFLVVFIAGAVVPLVALGAFQIISSYATQSAQVGDLQHEAAKSAAGTIDAYLAQIEDEMALVGQAWALRADESGDTSLGELLAYNVGFETLTLMDERGQEVAKVSRYALVAPGGLGNRADAPDFQAAQGGERYLGPVSISQYGEPFVTLAIPIEDKYDQVIGVLSAEVNLKYMWDLIGRIEIGSTGYAYVVNDDGCLIAHRDSSMVLQGQDLSGMEGVRNALQGQTITGSYTGLEGQEVIGNYYPLRQAGWFILVETPTQEALAGTYRAMIINFAVIVGTVVLAALLGWYMTRIVVQPVRRLQKGAEVIGGGDLAHRIDIRTRDEIGVLASAFNAMAAQLQEAMGTLEQRVADRTAEIEHLNLVLRAIRNVNQLIARERDRDRLLQGICETLIESRGYHHAWIALLDESEGLVTTAEAGLGEDFLPLVEQLKRGELTDCGQGALKQSGALVTEDPPSACANCSLSGMYGDRGAMTVRLGYSGKVYGLLSISIPRDLAADEEERALFEEVAGDIAFALYSVEQEEERKRAEEALRESEEKYRTILKNIEDGYYEVDIAGNFTFFNDALCRIFGYPADELMGMNERQLMDDETARAVYQAFNAAYRAGKPVKALEHEFIRKDGTRRSVEVSASLISDSVGESTGFRGIIRDITERKQAEEALRASEERFALAVKGANDGIYDWDIVNNTLYWSPRLKELLGYADDELDVDFDTFETLLHPDDREHTNAAIESHLRDRVPFNVEQRLHTKSGEYHWFSARGQAVWDEDGQPIRMVGSTTDITERKRTEEELAYMATHDALTGLPNRWLLNDRLTLELARAQRHQQKLALMLLDLDHFKDINDTLGHTAGDKLLQTVGERLTSLVRKSDTVARMGGDEFMLILLFPKIREDGDAVKIAQRVLEAFRTPFVFDGHEIHITTSVGISIYPDDGQDADILIKNADIAMYRAKAQGRDNYQRYS